MFAVVLLAVLGCADASLAKTPELPREWVDHSLPASYWARKADLSFDASTTRKELNALLLDVRPGMIIEFEAGVTWTHHYPLELPEQPETLQDANTSTISKRTGIAAKCEQLAKHCQDFKTRLGDGKWSVRDLCPVTCKVQPWILIRSSRHAELPPLGTRVGPEHANLMPKIVTDKSTPALATKFRAHHYYIHGVEFAVAPNVRENFGLIRLGTDGCSSCKHGDYHPSSVDQLPHHITFDQCYVHGNVDGKMQRGIELNARHAAVLNSYVSDFHHPGADSQAISTWNADGPQKIANNFLEGAGENIIFGGADPKIDGLVPQDIEIVDNHIYKPLIWRKRVPAWSVKNLFELKSARRVLLRGNVLENCWAHSQVGFAILLTARNQGGKAPWSVVEDVTIERNLILNVSSGISMMARSVPKDLWGNKKWVEPLRRILVRDNVIRLNSKVFGGDGFLFLLSSTTLPEDEAGEEDYARDISIVHNTGIHASSTGKSFVSIGPRVFGDGSFEFKNNIMTHGKYGFKGHAKPSGRESMVFMGDPFVFTRNALVGWTAEMFKKQNYPGGNTHVADLASVKFIAPPLGADYESLNFTLAKDSPLKGGADDGTDFGARLRADQLAQRSESEAVHFVPPTPPAIDYARAVFPPPGYPAPVRHVTGVTLPVLPKMFEHELTKDEYDPSRKADIVIAAGTSHKAIRDKIIKAPPGSIVELEAGATFTMPGPILLQNHTAPAKGKSPWIVVRSSAHAQLPNGRVGPQHASLMPKLVVTSSEPTIRALFGSHHYYFLGIEMTVDEGTPLNYGVVGVDKDHYLRRPAQTTSELPHHITFDRCYVHGHPTGYMKRGFALNGRYLAVVRSHVEHFQHKIQDTQAISCWNGAGPLKIVDNYLVASGENVLFGGADPKIVGLVPSDIEIRGNDFDKPLSWKEHHKWSVKNLFELKNARRVLVDGNTFQNVWLDSQHGYAIMLTPRNENGKAPWSAVEDLTFTRNLVINCSSGVKIISRDKKKDSHTGHISYSHTVKRLFFRDNVFFTNSSKSAFAGDGFLFQMSGNDAGPAQDIAIVRNTGIHGSPSGKCIVAVGPKQFCTNGTFAMVGNLLTAGKYGFKGDGVPPGRAGMDRYLGNDYVFTGNGLVGWTQDKFDQQNYPPGNTWIPNLSSAGFQEPTTADNLKLGVTSSLQKKHKYGGRLLEGPSPVGKCVSTGQVGVRVCASSLDTGSNRITAAPVTEEPETTGTDAPTETTAPTSSTPKPCVCSQDMKPVCGKDGKTYSNACKAACAGVEVDFDAPCTQKPTGSSGLLLKANKASLEFGPNGDIKLKRIADGKLALHAKEIDITGAVNAKKISIDGVSLDDYIASQVAKQVAKILQQKDDR